MIPDVLTAAATLLRTRPVLFLPRLALTAVTSIFWLLLIDAVRTPRPEAMLLLLVLFLATVPFQVWIFNAYIFIVRQYHEDTINLRAAFHAATTKLVEGTAAALLIMAAGILVMLPVSAVLVYGLATTNLTAIVIAAVLLLTAIFLIAVHAYFVPVTVVLGTRSFSSNLWHGVSSSREHRRPVTLLAFVSFTILAATLLVEGWMQQIGIIGFLTGRFMTAVVSVYLMILNPELYLEHQ